MRTHFRCDPAQKMDPTTNQFSIGFSVVKCSKYNHFFIRCIKVLLIDRGLPWDDFFGRGRAEDVFAFHEFSIFFDSVFCKIPEMIKIQLFHCDCSIKVNTVKTGTIRFIRCGVGATY